VQKCTYIKLVNQKQKSYLIGQTYFLRAFWLACTNMIFSHVKISYFLRVFKYDFSHWPKTLYNTYVYIIKSNITFMKAYLCVHAHPLVIVFFLYFTARCNQDLIFTIHASFTPVFLVLSEFFQPLATKWDIIITNDQTCTKIYQDMKANNDLYCNKNHFSYLLSF
jgi:hypothetical protein